MSSPPAAAMKWRPTIDPDRLAAIRAKAAEARDLDRQIADLQERLKELNKLAYNIYHKELPEMMGEAGVDKIGLPAEGNLPAMDAKLQPYYHAVIPASWPDEQRFAAFRYLENAGASDLITTSIEVSFPRGEHGRVRAFLNFVESQGLRPDVTTKVHWTTLTAWVRERCESGHLISSPEVIGANIGHIVKLTERGD